MLLSKRVKVGLAVGAFYCVFAGLGVFTKANAYTLKFCLSTSGQTITCPPQDSGQGNNDINNTQYYDPNQSPYLNPATPADQKESEIQRQLDLLKKAILQGQNYQNIAAENYEKTLPDLYKANDKDVKQFCEEEAPDAYGKAYSSFNEAQTAYDQATATPYIYDQMRGMNAAQSKLMVAKNNMAKADLAALNCQSALANSQELVQRNIAEMSSVNAAALGSIQQNNGEQKQWDVSKTSQEGKSVSGMQNGLINFLNGLGAPPNAKPGSLRPKRY
jgi:hypothetical protein